MKRISTPAPDDNFVSLKPLIGTKGQPPFYDPNDIHEHIWKKGKLGIEDNPKIPTYSKDKINIRFCEYCKICHKINKKFMNNNKYIEILKDYIEKTNDKQNDDYKIKNFNNTNIIKVEINEDPYNKINSNDILNYLMFKEKEEKFREYLKINK